MIAGILSIASSVDSPKHLTEAAANATQVTMAALFQFVLCLTTQIPQPKKTHKLTFPISLKPTAYSLKQPKTHNSQHSCHTELVEVPNPKFQIPKKNAQTHTFIN